VPSKVWYLAICVQCNGGLNSVVEHPEQVMPMPFDDRAERSEWTDAHMEGTGHSVLLMNQHDRTTNDITTDDTRHSDDKESTVHQTE
jgi:hypothetical protein